MTAIAQKIAGNAIKERMQQYAPVDPYYDEVINSKGKVKKVKRGVPPGLSARDEKILRKIRKRAHYLDKGMNLCGFRVGWTFFIGIVPGLGDIVDAGLNYGLVVRPATELDIPKDLLSKMLLNNAVSVAMGLVPLVGDLGLAAWRANSRNAHLIEAYLTIRGEEFLAQQGQAVAGTDRFQPEVSEHFSPGSGMHQAGMVGNGNGGGLGVSKRK
ncbi:MAG: hypothetical protein TREMPRED_004316 [Tremellales sp. Tagirdzhanova-0007]|nr:MAG: hypothetical protein TREMPRED_004316 [Tremellales sp. Tagirdzhanova-0007]